MIKIQELKKNKIKFNISLRNKVYKHCKRKLYGEFLENETRERQSYGLLGGRREKNIIEIVEIFPLIQNSRQFSEISNNMDCLAEITAIPSRTPIKERGWIASSSEVVFAYNNFKKNELELIGSYHMHHKESWIGTQPRNEPTEFDKILCKDTGLLMFIVDMSEPKYPSIRAFYEGSISDEILIAK